MHGRMSCTDGDDAQPFDQCVHDARNVCLSKCRWMCACKHECLSTHSDVQLATKMTTRRRSSQTTSLCAWQSCDSACELCLSKRTQHCAYACMPGMYWVVHSMSCMHAPQMSETLSCRNGGWQRVCVRGSVPTLQRCGVADKHTNTPSCRHTCCIGPFHLHTLPPTGPPCTQSWDTLDTPQRNLRHLFVKVDNFDRPHKTHTHRTADVLHTSRSVDDTHNPAAGTSTTASHSFSYVSHYASPHQQLYLARAPVARVWMNCMPSSVAYMCMRAFCSGAVCSVPRQLSARVQDSVGRSAPARRTLTMHLSHRHVHWRA